MTRDLYPFVIDKSVSVKSSAVWSRSIDAAKTAAYRMSQSSKHRVVKLALRNVLDYMMSGVDIDLDNKVVYIEVKSKPIQDSKTVGSLLGSFIDKVQLMGTQVSIFCSPLSMVILDSSIEKV